MEQQNPILGPQNQQLDWLQILHNREQQRIIQYGSQYRLLSSDTNGGSARQNQSFCQWTISLNKLQPLQQSESELNQDKQISTKSQLPQVQSKQTKRIKQDFDCNEKKNLESIPQEEQLFRYDEDKHLFRFSKNKHFSRINQSKQITQHTINKILKRTLSIKEVIDNQNSQLVKILQINQIWHKSDIDCHIINFSNRKALLIKRKNIILNKKSKLKQLDLSQTKVDVQMLKLIQNNLQQIQLLNIQQCKRFSYLQLSRLSQLKHIDVSHSPIRTVKLQKLQNLQSFKAEGCYNLSKITFDKCPKVVKINVSWCFSLVSLTSQHLKQLQKINLGFCKMFIWDSIQKCQNLQSFYASYSNINAQYANIILQNNPNLKQIDLDKCLQIKEKLHLKNNKFIKDLEINQGSISQLNLQNLNKLKELQLSKLPNFKKLIVTKCQNLKKIKFQKLNIDYIQLQDNPSIQQIKFWKCFEKWSQQFQMKFKDMSQKIKIYFQSCYISDQMIDQLKQLVKNHPKIQIFVNRELMFDGSYLIQSFSYLNSSLSVSEMDTTLSVSEDQENQEEIEDIEDDENDQILEILSLNNNEIDFEQTQF